MTALPELARKWNKALERGKGIRMEAEELDLLAAIGVGELLAMEASAELAGIPKPPPPHCKQCSDFVYFMQDQAGGPVKIGTSSKPVDRLHVHRISAAVRYRYIALFTAPKHMEGYLHGEFHIEHIVREWFHPTRRLLAYAEAMGVDERFAARVA